MRDEVELAFNLIVIDCSHKCEIKVKASTQKGNTTVVTE
jgi:hypothetical protein